MMKIWRQIGKLVKNRIFDRARVVQSQQSTRRFKQKSDLSSLDKHKWTKFFVKSSIYENWSILWGHTSERIIKRWSRV